jgi:quercetin dioxygenase-like cupin family protein
VNGSKVLKQAGFRWQGVAARRYKDEDAAFRGVTRQTLLGEGLGEEPLAFLTRYFEVEPGGFTTLELHRHPHAVVVVRGRGSVSLAGEEVALEPLDCVYVAPETPHQFRAAGDEPLGFLCMVDRARDRPRIWSEGGPEEA